MKRILVLMIALLFILATYLHAAEKEPTNWKSIVGDYSGFAYVKSPIGEVKETKVLLNIRKGKGKLFIIEMAYFDDKIAKFTKCVRVNEYKIIMRDNVIIDGTSIDISGSISSKDGKEYEGRLRYVKVWKNGHKEMLREFHLIKIKQISVK